MRRHTPPRRLLALVLALALAALVAAPQPARADMRSYAPTVVSVLVTETTLLAADNRLQVVTLSNTGAVAVWVCHAAQTPVVGRGFHLPAGATLTFSGAVVPMQGLKAIADGATATVAVGRG